MGDHVKTIVSPMAPEMGARIEVDKPNVVMNDEIAQKTVKMTDKLGVAEVDLALQVKQAREFLDWSCNHMKRDWMDWMQQSNQAIKDIQMARMALERESKTVIAACADVRDFFGSSEHQERMSRMREFVEVCERMKALKDNGFLDNIADTILKLS